MMTQHAYSTQVDPKTLNPNRHFSVGAVRITP